MTKQVIYHKTFQNDRKIKKAFYGILIIIFLSSCNSEKTTRSMSESNWRLGWRMIENSWKENYNLAESQFDSLLKSTDSISANFIIRGLEIKSKLSKDEEILRIISSQPSYIKNKICQQEFTDKYLICKENSIEQVKNRELQLKIIKLYVDDQAIRGNIMYEMIEKYQIDTTGIKTEQDWSNPDEVSIDEINQSELKLVIEEYGFPTKDQIGQEAMHGMFMIIQHADGDKEWQKSQLPKIKIAAQRGDLSKKSYAYLFDRIRVNAGKPQRYGSQFEQVNRAKGIAKLRETENLESLDKRRKEMGMMPIETYKRLILMK